MAEIGYTETKLNWQERAVVWSNISESDSSREFGLGGMVAEISVQVIGAFSGGTIVLEGSNNGTDYSDLKQLDGTLATAAVPAIMALLDRPLFIRPRVGGGTGQSITVNMVVRR